MRRRRKSLDAIFSYLFATQKPCDEIKKRARYRYRAFESTSFWVSLSLFDIALSFLLSKEESLHI